MNPQQISIEDYNYPLPDERIAKHPLVQRDRCKLLVRKHDGTIEDHRFNELPSLLPEGSLLIYNNTRVINARLRFRKESGALIEVFCLEPVSPIDYAVNFASTGASGVEWQCFVGNSKRWKDGKLMGLVGDSVLTAERVAKTGNSSIIRFSWTGDMTFAEIIAAAGELPIPPYLNRPTEQSDMQDYQTVFSKVDGSVAAPTAGLHFTPELLKAVDAAGMQRRELTLHVGAGTFQPVKSEQIGQHEMHSEFICVERRLIEELADTDRPIIAVGTTSVRTLESLYHLGCLAAQGRNIGELPQWYPYSAEHPRLSRKDALQALAKMCGERLVTSTRVIIAPGYEYKVVDGIITNFHQPKSTLLLLVSAFVGDGWHKMYSHALADPDYRFLSYGDACLLL
ncbi:MAG: S-adenosylmethionine:tRNA ribosyltransferase-isomerase [Bacteroides sp.]|nr:S-adenosylmethionine:tRNA ribosyltransferase-isomerase [Bacteroides sp.]MCM1379845.1 S-adenosylmethionine:tRNA ribosyltransferase-isomerase [Bacteroides sp.]MCM1446123.1 S-adenosylmethionine:tRNA ribosyltransferase-isomerase [Prevotella sp.]